MRINSPQTKQESDGSAGTGGFSSTKNFYALTPGERFKALIVDIKLNQVTIRLESGGTFTARTMVPPEARIGEECIFAIRENNFKGQIILEMIRSDIGTQQNNITREALRHAGLYVSEENIALGRALIANGLPVDAATLQRATFFRYAQPDMTTDKVLFLLRENMPVTAKSIHALNAVLDGRMHLQKSLSELLETIAHESTAAWLKEATEPNGLKPLRPWLSVFFGNDAALPKTGDAILKQQTDAEAARYIHAVLKEALYKRFLLQMQKDAPLKPLKAYYNDLWETVTKAAQSLPGDLLPGKAAERLAEVSEALTFMRQVSQTREYYQIPFYTDNQQTLRQGELFIYKDTAAGKNLSRQASALIALDTAALGRVEVFIQKTGKQVKLQFGSDKDASVRLFVGQSALLTKALQSSGFSVTGFTSKKIDQAITTLVSPNPAGSPKTETAPKRYTFDMRI